MVLGCPKLPEAMGYGLICHGWPGMTMDCFLINGNDYPFRSIYNNFGYCPFPDEIQRFPWGSEITIVILVDMDLKIPIHIVDCRQLGGAATKWPYLNMLIQ